MQPPPMTSNPYPTYYRQAGCVKLVPVRLYSCLDRFPNTGAHPDIRSWAGWSARHCPS
ncbi:hypothetical protein F751_6040 [Auxenochlorella protothecoides]|uniref:Uncharacterized protein n=1 Tax=Auxenochlorella protothecoides TaxID=3075 RepID=A0A087SI28_AUXPR|nr:hypothetical protein F751_6040 [Auxenochlorella protothecoides]KFM25382.1 hypothetical protein F751_6040 [Auxenochlorella protothecoides]